MDNRHVQSLRRPSLADAVIRQSKVNSSPHLAVWLLMLCLYDTQRWCKDDKHSQTRRSEARPQTDRVVLAENEPPSQSFTLTNSMPLTNGTSLSSCSVRTTENLKRFFFIDHSHSVTVASRGRWSVRRKPRPEIRQHEVRVTTPRKVNKSSFPDSH